MTSIDDFIYFFKMKSYLLNFLLLKIQIKYIDAKNRKSLNAKIEIISQNACFLLLISLAANIHQWISIVNLPSGTLETDQVCWWNLVQQNK